MRARLPSLTRFNRMDSLFGMTEIAKTIGDEEAVSPGAEIQEKVTSQAQDYISDTGVHEMAT
jgi:hypothetical protein